MTPPAKHATILVVDDDPAMLLLCQKILQNAGHEVLQAPGSSEALKLYAEHGSPIDVVLADVVLPPPGFQLSVENNPYPRVNGSDMVDRLLSAKKEVRIILMSSTSALDLQAKGLLRNGLPFLMKPFAADALLELVQKVLAGPPATLDPKRAADSGKGDVDWFG